ncbi:MAG: DNA polymerase, partial [Terriglobia bacterium]
GDLKDASLGRDGRFHSEYPYEPDTGRLASKRPNLQNVPQGREGGVEGQIADLIRSTIIPDDGKVLMEFDWKAIEAVLTGWFANDPGYIRLSLLDSHGFYTSFLLAEDKKIPEAFDALDPDLASKLEWLKKNFPRERVEGKKINLALGYGMGLRLLARILRIKPAEAVKFITIKDKMAPIVTEWKGRTQRQAHYDGRLINPFGYVRNFFSVFTKTKSGDWRLGEEANEALAFLPQSTAASMLRWVLVELGGLEKKEDFELLIPIHDAVVLQTKPTNVKRVAEVVKKVMERQWIELNDLSIQVSVKVGRSWGEMKEYV